MYLFPPVSFTIVQLLGIKSDILQKNEWFHLIIKVRKVSSLHHILETSSIRSDKDRKRERERGRERGGETNAHEPIEDIKI